MKLQPHTADDFADAIKNLLPLGDAWNWTKSGFGYSMLRSTAQELARVDAAEQGILDNAIETHRPQTGNWHISEYRRVAQESLGGLTETMPRRMFGVGSKVGDRVWSHNAPNLTFPVDLVQVDHLVGPLRVGSKAGDRLWGHRSRYVLRVRYYRSVVDAAVVWKALDAFKQAHVYLWFEDITGVGGSYAPD